MTTPRQRCKTIVKPTSYHERPADALCLKRTQEPAAGWQAKLLDSPITFALRLLGCLPSNEMQLEYRNALGPSH